MNLLGACDQTWNITANLEQATLERIRATHPYVNDAIALIEKQPQLLVATSIQSYEQHVGDLTLCKPEGHARAHYVCCDTFTIAVKGSEILVDSDALSKRIANANESQLHWFILVEGIAPFAHVYSECIDECEKALQVQKMHFDRFGHLASLPFPLLVFRVPNKHWQAYEHAIAARLKGSKYLEQKLEKNLSTEDGIGIYVYCMEERPVPRVAHVAAPVESASTLEAFVFRHARQVFKLLLCGYFAVNPGSSHKGSALQFQNVIRATGSFVDVDTLTHVNDVKSEILPDLVRMTYENMTYTIFYLIHGERLNSSFLACYHEKANVGTQSQQLHLPIVLALFKTFQHLRTEFHAQGYKLLPILDTLMFGNTFDHLIGTRELWFSGSRLIPKAAAP